MKIVIVGSGNKPGKDLLMKHCHEADMIIAADGGSVWLMAYQIIPDVLIGDFDSINKNTLKDLENNKITRCVYYQADKDETDMELCIHEAIRLQATEITILGATGTRMDHTLINVSLLLIALRAGISAYIVNDHNRISLHGCEPLDKNLQCSSAQSVLHHKEESGYKVTIKKNRGYYLSLIAMSQTVTSIQTTGLLFNMRGRDLSFGSSLGISNAFVQQEAEISFQEGLLLITQSRD